MFSNRPGKPHTCSTSVRSSWGVKISNEIYWNFVYCYKMSFFLMDSQFIYTFCIQQALLPWCQRSVSNHTHRKDFSNKTSGISLIINVGKCKSMGKWKFSSKGLSFRTSFGIFGMCKLKILLYGMMKNWESLILQRVDCVLFGRVQMRQVIKLIKVSALLDAVRIFMKN